MDRSNRESGYRCTEEGIRAYNNKKVYNNSNNMQQLYWIACLQLS